MGKAWPRFLPAPTPEAIAHALIIEASAIVVDRLGDGHGDLFKAHRRAEVFARAQYGEDHLERALAACAAQPDNENILLHRVLRFAASSDEDDARPPRIRPGHHALRPAFAANA